VDAEANAVAPVFDLEILILNNPFAQYFLFVSAHNHFTGSELSSHFAS
jgi:hypothetical protein